MGHIPTIEELQSERKKKIKIKDITDDFTFARSIYTDYFLPLYDNTGMSLSFTFLSNTQKIGMQIDSFRKKFEDYWACFIFTDGSRYENELRFFDKRSAIIDLTPEELLLFCEKDLEKCRIGNVLGEFKAMGDNDYCEDTDGQWTLRYTAALFSKYLIECGIEPLTKV